jgi:O-antigen/teichoic acid export membrane protein
MTEIQSSSLLTKSLKARVLGAGGWSVAGHLATLFVRLAGTLILSRIFSPAVFGEVAFLIVVQVVIALLTDIGLRPSVIQHRDGDDPVFLGTAWTLQVLRGLVITVIGLAVAAFFHLSRDWMPPGSAYAEPSLPLYLAVSMLSATIIGFQSMKVILASRKIQLVGQIAIELLTQIAALGFIAIFGWITRSIWAYVFGLLFSAVVTVALSNILLAGPRIRFGWDRHALREMSRFGKWTMMSTALSAFSVNGDRLMLGGWMSVEALGSYSIANNLNSFADGLASRIFGSIAFPALTETFRRDASRFRTIYFRIRLVTDSGLLFVGGFLHAAGQAVVDFMYDQRYASAGWMLQTLSLGLLFTRYEIAQNAYFALGRPNYVTLLSVVKLISLFTIVPLLYYFFSIQGAIIGIAIHMAPCAICVFILNRKHQLNDFLFEACILLVWLAGELSGTGGALAIAWLKMHLKTFL